MIGLQNIRGRRMSLTGRQIQDMTAGVCDWMDEGVGDEPIVDGLPVPEGDNFQRIQTILTKIDEIEVEARDISGGVFINDTNYTKFVGVAKPKSSVRWQVRINVGKKNKYIGSYDCDVEAAKVYIAKAKKYGFEEKYEMAVNVFNQVMEERGLNVVY